MSAIMITGYTGTRHIRPSMDAAVYRGAFGNENYVLSEDDNCEGSMPSVNEFVVADGCVSMQGHAVQIKLESLAVDTCATGYARIDLVCCRFTHNTSSLIDNATLVVIKGDEVADSNTPQPPAYSEGIIDEGATQVDFPMYKITMHGGTVTFERLFTLVASLEECTLSPGTQTKWNNIADGASNDEIMDYVADNVIVEQGTEDIWTYRKWANGIAECWGRITGTANITTTWGQIYFASAFSQSLPTGLFIDVPSIQMLNHSSNSALIMGGSSISKDSFNIHLVRGTSQSNAAYNIGCYCIGKWK